MLPKFDMNVPQHAEVVAVLNDHDASNTYVLCKWRGEFVTWLYHNDATYYGHYFQDFDKAAKDLFDRAGYSI